MERAFIELALAQPEENHRGDDEDVNEAGNHPADLPAYPARSDQALEFEALKNPPGRLGHRAAWTKT